MNENTCKKKDYTDLLLLVPCQTYPAGLFCFNPDQRDSLLFALLDVNFTQIAQYV